MFDWIKTFFPASTTDTVGGGAPVQAIPWYIPVTLVIIGGVLIYKVGAKVLKI